MKSVFRGFLKNFELFFGELEQGFVSEMVVSLFARSYQSGEVVFEAGSVVTKLMFITCGQLAICDPTSKQDPFLILPEKSFYGDFQILKNVPCFYTVKALSDDHFEM